MNGTYLVVGANGGLGSAVVTSLRGGVDGISGAIVVEADLPELDLTDPALGARLVELWETRGPFEGMVHAAGLYPAKAALQTDAELFDRVMAVNARSALLASATVARLAIEAGRTCSIVVISSGAARFPQNGTVAYAASKAAVEAIVRGLALETGGQGIRVNAVAPGFVQVGSKINPVPSEYISALVSSAPQQRVATPDDIVPAILWLLSDASHWINGQSIAVDGGSSLGSPVGPTWLEDR